MTLSVDVLNQKGEKVEALALPESIFGVKPHSRLVHEVVNAYLANTRRGTHSTKTRGEVSGGGLKPWKQKGTGNARSGSIRSPLWRRHLWSQASPRVYAARFPAKTASGA